MTINKEQPVSDAVLAKLAEKCAMACCSEAFPSTATFETRILKVLREHAASHPLEQQQAVRMREALQGIVDSWDRNTHQREKHVESEYGPYWSPASAMVDSEFIAAARTALQGGE